MTDNSQHDTDESSRKMASSLVYSGEGKQSVLDVSGATAGGGQRTREDWSKAMCEGGSGRARALQGYLGPALSVYKQLPNHHGSYYRDTYLFSQGIWVQSSGLNTVYQIMQNKLGSPSFQADLKTDLKETGCGQTKNGKSNTRTVQRQTIPAAMCTAILLNRYQVRRTGIIF